MTKQHRTKAALLAAALLVVGMTAQASERLPTVRLDSQGQPVAVDPYVEVVPMATTRIKGLDRSVIYLFAADCSFSRQIHDRIMGWGTTLPDGWRLIPLHVVGPGYTGPTPIAMTARMLAAQGVGDFHEADYWTLLFEAVQEARLDPEDVRGVLDIAVAAGAHRESIEQATTAPEVLQAIDDAVDVMLRYRPARVPVLIIADRYMTHPDLTGSNPVDVIRVANALVSKTIRDTQNKRTEE